MAGACAGAGRGSKRLVHLCVSSSSSYILVALSFLVKPAAGMLGFVTHPIEGTIKSIRSGQFQDVYKERHLTRYREGIMEAQGCSQADREAIINTFMAFQYSANGKGKKKSK